MGFADSGDGLEELIHAQQSERAGVNGNDDRVSDDQSVHGRRPHGRRRADEDDVEVGQDRPQLPAQKELAIDLFRFQKVVGFDGDGVGQEFQLGTDVDEVAADLRRLVDQERMRRTTQLIQIDAEAGAGFSILEIDGDYGAKAKSLILNGAEGGGRTHMAARAAGF